MDELRVLLVDDDEDDFIITRELLRDALGASARVEWVWTPEAALEKLTADAHDVALVDYNLGAMTGVELLRAAVAHGCRIPIIMLTGQADRVIDLEAMHAGAADYLVKSRVTSDMLERAIRYARERRRLLDQISELSLTDELTGLNNRRAFLTLADQRLQLLARTRTRCVMLFADVDGLKQVNDVEGHGAGDRLLISAAAVFRSAFRTTDLVARLGGDEFVVLAEITCDEDVDTLLDRLADQIAQFNSRNALHDMACAPLSISVGALPFTTGPSQNLQGLIAEADIRMLQKKAHRRASLAAAPELQPA